MAEFPYLPLWTDAYLADTVHLTNEEHGIYLRLLMAAWRTVDCALPMDDRRLARTVGLSLNEWAAVKETILEFFTLEDGRYKQKRLFREREILVSRKRSGSKGGKTAQANRKQNSSSRARTPDPDPHPDSEPEPEPQPENSTCAEPASPPAAQSPVFIRLPLASYGKDGAVASVTEAQIETWEKSYPGVDVRQQLRNMEQWLVHNPTRRKTPRGIGRFITGWLSKAQDRGPGGGGPGRGGGRRPTGVDAAAEIIREMREEGTDDETE